MSDVGATAPRRIGIGGRAQGVVEVIDDPAQGPDHGQFLHLQFGRHRLSVCAEIGGHFGEDFDALIESIPRSASRSTSRPSMSFGYPVALTHQSQEAVSQPVAVVPLGRGRGWSGSAGATGPFCRGVGGRAFRGGDGRFR